MLNNDKKMAGDARSVLMGNPRQMLKTKSPGPIAFARALNLYLASDFEKQTTNDTDDLVLTLANALQLELSGESTEAHRIYRRVSDSHIIEVQILARFLDVWTLDVDYVLADQLRNLVIEMPTKSLEERRLRNICFLRLITFCADGGQRPIAHSLVREAQSFILGDLAQGLKWIARDWFGEGSSWWLFKLSRDEILVPWVHQAIDSDLHEQMEKIFLRESQSIWSQGFSFESIAGGRAGASAELQAAWAGALWALPKTRKTQALHAWSSGNVNDSARVASLWLLGSGKDVGSVMRKLEATFSAESASQIVSEMHGGARVPNQDSWLEALLILWDLLPEVQLLELVTNESLKLEDEVLFSTARSRFIAVAARRLGAQWFKVFQAISPANRKLILSEISPIWAAQLNKEVQDQLLKELRDDKFDNNSNWERAALLTTLGENEQTALKAAGELDTEAIVNLVEYLPIASEAVSAALARQLELAERWLSSAEQGTYSFGVSHPAILRVLAQKAGATDVSGKKTWELLTKMWVSTALPVMDRLSALNCLYELRAWYPDVEIPQPSDSRGNWLGFEGAPQRVLPIAWFAVAPPNIDWESAGVQIVSASRDPDSRVRSFAAEITAMRNDRVNKSVLDTVMLAALFDPEPSVLVPLLKPNIIAALGPEAVAVFNSRILDVAKSQVRWVREVIAQFVRNCEQVGMPINPELKNRLREDRSWLVRISLGNIDTAR